MFHKIILRLIFLILPDQVFKHIGVRIGDRTRIISPSFNMFGSEPYLVEIGHDCEITSGVEFVTHDGGLWVIRNIYEKYRKADFFDSIKVGNNVFIGINSVVLPGAQIESDCIFGAGALIVKGTYTSGVYAGVPARRLCSIDEYVAKNKSSFLYTKGLSSDEKRSHIVDALRGRDLV